MDGKADENICDPRPLAGRRVVVTRPRGQSEEITSLFEGMGAAVIHCPTIEIREPDDPSGLDRAIERLETYDWIVFTSANGVDFFFRRLARKRPDPVSALEGRLLCAIGPATAASVEAAGASVALVASDSKAEGAFAAIVERLGGEHNVRGVRFLIPRARIARDFLPSRLAELGATVDAVETYQTVRPNLDSQSIIRLFTEDRPDVITFTSSSTVTNLASLVGMKDLGGLLAGITIACIGPVTAATAREHGLTNILQPETYTAAALVEAVARSIGRNG
ncbi:MAG TPA: uroporphyrinogen-III synthase [Blastocatellia bacterium]|nr:uroporphyrinogen-III synthase [Blastocatellia bacterium]